MARAPLTAPRYLERVGGRRELNRTPALPGSALWLGAQAAAAIPPCAEARALARYCWWPRGTCSSRPDGGFYAYAAASLPNRCRRRACGPAASPSALPDLPPSSTAPFIRGLSRLDGAGDRATIRQQPGSGHARRPPPSSAAAWPLGACHVAVGWPCARLCQRCARPPAGPACSSW